MELIQKLKDIKNKNDLNLAGELFYHSFKKGFNGLSFQDLITIGKLSSLLNTYYTEIYKDEEKALYLHNFVANKLAPHIGEHLSSQLQEALLAYPENILKALIPKSKELNRLYYIKILENTKLKLFRKTKATAVVNMKLDKQKQAYKEILSEDNLEATIKKSSSFVIEYIKKNKSYLHSAKEKLSMLKNKIKEVDEKINIIQNSYDQDSVMPIYPDMNIQEWINQLDDHELLNYEDKEPIINIPHKDPKLKVDSNKEPSPPSEYKQKNLDKARNIALEAMLTKTTEHYSPKDTKEDTAKPTSNVKQEFATNPVQANKETSTDNPNDKKHYTAAEVSSKLKQEHKKGKSV